MHTLTFPLSGTFPLSEHLSMGTAQRWSDNRCSTVNKLAKTGESCQTMNAISLLYVVRATWLKYGHSMAAKLLFILTSRSVRTCLCAYACELTLQTW